MAKKFNIIYTDGRHDVASMTMRAMCKAEEIMAAEGMNASTDTINATMRSVYCYLRFSGKTDKTFDDWLDSVDDFEPIEEEKEHTDPLA